MTFVEKSTLTMTLVLVVVFGAYFTVVLGPVAASPDRQGAFTALFVLATILLTGLAAGSHIVLAVLCRREAGAGRDERDQLIALRSARLSGYVLATGVFAGIVLAMLEAAAFWIAQALVAGWVLAEVSAGISTLVQYRRGA